jgi:MbtH protein
MANPFEDPDASYRVLVNHEGQHSLWPAAQPVPDGWTVVHDTDSRASCLEYIEKNWTDMRPKSLIEAQGELPRASPVSVQAEHLRRPEHPGRGKKDSQANKLISGIPREMRQA